MTELTEKIKDRDVLLVEDIVDSGLTVQYLTKALAKQKPRSIKVCTLLSKPERRVVDVQVQYIGFRIPNQYVVGVWTRLPTKVSEPTVPRCPR